MMLLKKLGDAIVASGRCELRIVKNGAVTSQAAGIRRRLGEVPLCSGVGVEYVPPRHAGCISSFMTSAGQTIFLQPGT
jgi:hypothetical protein